MPSRNERRNQLIEAALKVFTEHGFHNAKIEDIAKTAGVGKGTVYEYFESKKSLFHEMIKYCMELYSDEAMKILSQENSLENKLLAFVKFHGRGLSKNIHITQAIIGESMALSEEMKHWMIAAKMKVAKLMQGVLEEGIKNGEIRADLDSELATLSIFGTINNYYMKKIYFDKISYENIDPKKVVDMMFKGLG